MNVKELLQRMQLGKRTDAIAAIIASGILAAFPLYEIATPKHYRGITLLSPFEAHSIDGDKDFARFWNPQGLCVDDKGNVYVADTGDHIIRKIAPDGTVKTIAGVAGHYGDSSGPVSAARFTWPTGIAFGPDGSLYISDSGNDIVRKITSDGVVSIAGGQSGQGGIVDGPATKAHLVDPHGITVAPSGLIFTTSVRAIRKISPDGMVSTLAGSNISGARDGIGRSARFENLRGLALDRDDNVYAIDGSATIRKITPQGDVTTVAGMPLRTGYVDGPGGTAQFDNLNGIAIDEAGNVYVTDTDNYVIRKIAPSGIVSTFAGTPHQRGRSDGSGTQATFWRPWGLAIDLKGTLYVTDDNVIRKIYPSGLVTTIAGQVPPLSEGKK